MYSRLTLSVTKMFVSGAACFSPCSSRVLLLQFYSAMLMPIKLYHPTGHGVLGKAVNCLSVWDQEIRTCWPPFYAGPIFKYSTDLKTCLRKKPKLCSFRKPLSTNSSIQTSLLVPSTQWGIRSSSRSKLHKSLFIKSVQFNLLSILVAVYSFLCSWILKNI